MNKPTSVSYSSLTRWTDCPSSWKNAYIDKEKGPVTEAGRRGNDFDELVAHRLGCVVYERDGVTKKPVPAETLELKRMLDAYAAHEDSWLRTKPEQNPQTQVKVSCTPEQWAELAEKWGSTSRIHYSYIGFTDLKRDMEDGIRSEVLDLKTSNRAEFKSTWPAQVITYAAILGCAKASIHLIVPQVKEVKVLTKEFILNANKQIVRNCLNWVAFNQAHIEHVINSEMLSELPQTPGYHCAWCAVEGCKSRER